MYKRIREFKWYCPYCKAKGLKWLTKHGAERNGRIHIKNTHNKTGNPKITVRRIK